MSFLSCLIVYHTSDVIAEITWLLLDAGRGGCVVQVRGVDRPAARCRSSPVHGRCRPDTARCAAFSVDELLQAAFHVQRRE